MLLTAQGSECFTTSNTKALAEVVSATPIGGNRFGTAIVCIDDVNKNEKNKKKLRLFNFAVSGFYCAGNWAQMDELSRRKETMGHRHIKLSTGGNI